MVHDGSIISLPNRVSRLSAKNLQCWSLKGVITQKNNYLPAEAGIFLRVSTLKRGVTSCHFNVVVRAQANDFSPRLTLMDIPRRDFIPRFKLMETRWHPIRTDKPERPRCGAPIILPLPPSEESSMISPRFHCTPSTDWIKRLRVPAYSSIDHDLCDSWRGGGETFCGDIFFFK